jgi:hypothetical protein
MSAALAVTDTLLDAAFQPLFSHESVVLHAWPLVPLAALSSAVLGAVVVQRYPRHRIGWLLVLIGSSTLVSVTCEAYSIWVVDEGGPGSRDLGVATGWVSALTGGPAALTGLALLFLLAPDGHLMSGRWRFPLWAALAGLGLFLVGLLVTDPDAYAGRGDDDAGSTASESFMSLGVLLITAVLLVGTVAMIVRLRRATGDTRLQLRWFAMASAIVAAGITSLVAVQLSNGGEQTVASAMPLQVSYLLLPVCLAISVLRHRLYDIDLIINRAVLLAVSALVVAVGYVALVVLVAQLLGDQVPGFLPSVLATAAVAMAFQPLRRWVVRLADRLAFGSRAAPYDALSAFSRRLGDSPDPASLLPAVAEAAGRAVSAVRSDVTRDVPAGDAETASWTAPHRGHLGGEPATLVVADASGPLGSIVVTPAAGRTVRPHERALLADIAEHAAVAFRNVRLQEELADKVAALAARTTELAASRRRLLEAGDAERRRVEQAIGREVLPALRDLTATLQSADDMPPVDVLVARTTAALEALRELTRGIFPTVLTRSGLGPALTTHLARAGQAGVLTVDASAEGRRFTARTEAAVFFSAAAAAQAGPVGAMTLAVDDGSLLLTVDGAAPLDGERQAVLDRVEALGGTLTDGGGHLVVRLPADDATVPEPRSDQPEPVST